jgi:hypothetical protein
MSHSVTPDGFSRSLRRHHRDHRERVRSVFDSLTVLGSPHARAVRDPRRLAV